MRVSTTFMAFVGLVAATHGQIIPPDPVKHKHTCVWTVRELVDHYRVCIPPDALAKKERPCVLLFIEGIPKIKDAAKSRGAGCGSGRDDELHLDVPKAAGQGRQPVFQGLKRVLGSAEKPQKVHVLSVKVSEALEDDGKVVDYWDMHMRGGQRIMGGFQ